MGQALRPSAIVNVKTRDRVSNMQSAIIAMMSHLLHLHRRDKSEPVAARQGCAVLMSSKAALFRWPRCLVSGADWLWCAVY